MGFTEFIWRKLGFNSDAEMTNFSAHAGWSLALPLLGLVLFGAEGMAIAAVAWLTWTAVNEAVLHGPTGRREVIQDLLSRFLPCTLVLIWWFWRHGSHARPLSW